MSRYARGWLLNRKMRVALLAVATGSARLSRARIGTRDVGGLRSPGSRESDRKAARLSQADRRRVHLHRRARCCRHSPETGRRNRAPVRRAIPAAGPAKAKPPAKVAAVAVISSQRAASNGAEGRGEATQSSRIRNTPPRFYVSSDRHRPVQMSCCGRPARSKLIRNPDIRDRGRAYPTTSAAFDPLRAFARVAIKGFWAILLCQG
jgi:hypothetical protein